MPKLMTRQPTAVVACVSKVEQFRKDIDSAFAEIEAYLLKIGHVPLGVHFVLYHSLSPDQSGYMHVTAGMATAHAIDGGGHVKAGSIPTCKAAVDSHLGSYETLPLAYQRLHTWILEQGLRPARKLWELYITGPTGTKRSDKWQTDIYWMVHEQSQINLI